MRLVHVSDAMPGIRRARRGRGFAYVAPGGRPISATARLRIRALAIPPAWSEVWICPHANGHIQATGRDARGRKQYRYHEAWKAHRSRDKYHELVAFARGLPALRRAIDRDLSRRALDRRRVLAAVVALLDRGLVRVGNAEYTRANRTFGLTTLRNGHAQVRGSTIRLRFRGKSGVLRDVSVHDPRLARVIRRCQELPGQELFAWIGEDGEVRDVGSADVNAYLREVSGRDITAKHFRTWGGTVIAATTLVGAGAPRREREQTRAACRAIEVAARHLGNRPATCRGFYVHPAVLQAFVDGWLAEAMCGHAPRKGLAPAEVGVLELLERAERRAGRRSA